VQPVGADHQVEPPLEPAGEADVDAVSVLAQRLDAVAEQVLGGVLGGGVEDLGQVPAQDLDLRDQPVAVELVGAQRATRRFFLVTRDMPSVSVQAARTCSSSPIRRTTCLATPRMSMAWPPGRSPGERSTTVAWKPNRCSQYARAGPAMLAPEIKICLLTISGP
jgi:hypothetical protein